jgi:hypothetical protein
VTLKRNIAAAAAAITLGAAGSAVAAGLSTSQAGQAASQAAQAVRKEVHASRVKVNSCKRLSASKVVCRAEARYTTGARRCTFEIIVVQGSSKSRRPRTSPANFVCY